MAKKKKAERRGRGEGSVEQLPDGRWRAVWSLGVIAGKRRRRKFYGATKSEALQKMYRAQGRAGEGLDADGGRLTVADWLTRWLALKAAKVAAKTHHRYEQTARNHLAPVLGPLRLAAVQAAHVESLYAALAAAGVSRSEQRRAGSTLSVALADACRQRLIPYNPCADVRQPPKGRRAISPLTREEVPRFLAAAAGDRLEALFVLWLDAGLRPQEIIPLLWTDLDLGARTVTVTKALSEVAGRLELKEVKTERGNRTVVFSEFTARALASHRERMRAEGRDVGRGLVFCDSRGGWLRQAKLHERVFAPLLKRAGLRPIRPYDLRHTCATLLLLAGVNIKVVSERLGHSSIQVTLDNYIHLLPGMQEQAADRMGEILAGSLSPASPPDGKGNSAPSGAKPSPKKR